MMVGNAELEAAILRFNESYAAAVKKLLDSTSEKLEAFVDGDPEDAEVLDETDEEDEDEEDEDAPKFRVGDRVRCVLCGSATVKDVFGSDGAYRRYALSGMADHDEEDLELVERGQMPPAEATGEATPLCPEPKYKVGQFVWPKACASDSEEITAVDTTGSEPVYTTEDEYGVWTRLESRIGGLADWPAPHFQVGQRITWNDEGGYITAVTNYGGPMQSYKFEILMDNGVTRSLFDYDYSRDTDFPTAQAFISREDHSPDSDEVPF